MGAGARRAMQAVIVVAIIAMVVCAGVIVWVLLSYQRGDATYDQVREVAFDISLDELLGALYEEDSDPYDPYLGDDVDLSSLVVDWDALLAVNPDTVGWIYIPGTVINYPVVHSSDNNEYLYINFNGERATGVEATYGTPFLLAQNAADFSDLNNIIQAHNMANGSMFAWIGNSALKNQDELLQKRTVFLLTPTANYRLNSISVLNCEANDPVTQTQFSSQAEFSSFVQSLMDRSSVDLPSIGIEASDVTRLVCVSTCTSDGLGDRNVLICAVTGYADMTGTG